MTHRAGYVNDKMSHRANYLVATFASCVYKGAMTRDEFRACLASLDMTVAQFAATIRVRRSTVDGWGGIRNGRPARVPRWVEWAVVAIGQLRRLDAEVRDRIAAGEGE